MTTQNPNIEGYIARIKPLFDGLHELEKKVVAVDLPLDALKIAGSRIDMAFSSQREADFLKAKLALEQAQQFYAAYEKEDLEWFPDSINIINDMRMGLYRDHPEHYLCRQFSSEPAP